jgi:hypothetical protein
MWKFLSFSGLNWILEAALAGSALATSLAVANDAHRQTNHQHDY